MNDPQSSFWAVITARIKTKRVFLAWFSPLLFVCIWILTYNVTDYYICRTSLSTESTATLEPNRALTLNRPENFDLGLTSTAYSINPNTYEELVKSTDFICTILTTPVTTLDSSFVGTYYEYLATQYRYPKHVAFLRFLHGIKQPAVGEQLPALNPFCPRDIAAEAIGLAQMSISCSVDRHTELTTISVTAQDPLVAAIIAQSVADNLTQVTSDYFMKKSEDLYEHLQEQLGFIHAEHKEAIKAGDNAYATMLDEAYNSFQRQAIIFNARRHYFRTFITLNNVSVPTEKSGPWHLIYAVPFTLFILILVVMFICRREILEVINSTQD